MLQWRCSTASHLRTVASHRQNSSSLSLLPFRFAPYHMIQAIPRECSVSRIAARDKMQGRIPAVVFFQNLLEKDPSARSTSNKHLLTIEKKQMKAILDSVDVPFLCSTWFPLQIRAGSGSSHLLESETELPIKPLHATISHREPQRRSSPSRPHQSHRGSRAVKLKDDENPC
ncbi:hypothetical protein RIF29_19706 [Crotalaria pallida]|uniref:Uncharacterized protein n=1 Tax=Crotalaria pallida TaxID=3830 RepID=A0AAN9F0D5_CROPI